MAGVFYILISGLVMAVIFGALSFIVLKVRLIPVVSKIFSFSTCMHNGDLKQKQTGATSGAGTVYPSGAPEFTPGSRNCLPFWST